MHRYVLKEVPVSYFQGEAWLRKAYLARSCELADEAVRELRVGSECEFHVCTGFVNDAIAQRLAAEGFKVVRVKIVGETQRLVEGAYVGALRALGVSNLSPDAGKNRFYVLLEWVHGDLGKREGYVKTGWEAWRKKWRYWKA